MSKLLTEMYTILGHAHNLNITQTAIDPNPHEVTGCFAVEGETTVLDEALLESIGELSWDQISDIALLATIQPTDFQSLALATAEGIGTFRETWNALAEDGGLVDGVKRGAFILAVNSCPKVESLAKYVFWCVRALQEAGQGVQDEARKKSSAMKTIIPTGDSVAQKKDSDETEAYMSPHDAKNDKPLMKAPHFKSADEKDKERSAKMADLEKAVGAVTKMASSHGQAPDQAYPNLYVDLARERVRNT